MPANVQKKQTTPRHWPWGDCICNNANVLVQMYYALSVLDYPNLAAPHLQHALSVLDSAA
jgi:hypothetical protein